MTVIMESKVRPKPRAKRYEIQTRKIGSSNEWDWFRVAEARTKFGAYCSFWDNEFLVGKRWEHRIVDKGVSDVD